MATSVDQGQELERILGVHTGTMPGPTIVVSGGLHGNEPAGARAVQLVLQQLSGGSIPFSGKLAGVRGNLAALAAGRRFVDQDLNRLWSTEAVDRLRADGPRQACSEDREQSELLAVFGALLAEAEGPVVFLDLHTTSGRGVPFVCVGDALRNLRVALALPLPLILGLDEAIDGSMLGYLTDLGHVGIAVEGGQHEDPTSVTHHAAAIWLVLVAAGSVRARDVPGLDRQRAQLGSASRRQPRVVEIRHRQHADDEFVMEPGFVSFQPIAAGQVVARDRNGPVSAPVSGRMLMPRYQGQGDDGYFLVRDVRGLWLSVSAVIRRLRLDRLIPLIPGVRVHPEQPDRLVIGSARSRGPLADLLRLCGYRRWRPEGNAVVVSRRRPG
jgi:succinylglutamate desuccinylase